MKSDATFGTRSVAVVDDDAEVRNLLAAALAKDGIGVTQIEDGDALIGHLDRAAADPAAYRLPDVIVMDVRMPGSSGLAILATLQTSRSPAPVILITAFGDEATHEAAARLGAVAVFDKPFELEDLRVAVRRAAGRT
jgi:CheY-like chemotaxis protein